MKTKKFEEFVNEEHKSNISIKNAVETASFQLNILNLLMDEGYIDDFGNIEKDVKVEDINSFLEEENHNLKFDSDKDVHNFIQSVKISCKSLSNKIE